MRPQSAPCTRWRITENRLGSSIRNPQVEAENLAAAISRIGDTDFASEAAGLARDLLLSKVGVAARAQANLNAGTVLRLLG
jgi:flagellin